jgi:hypothetical protein
MSPKYILPVLIIFTFAFTSCGQAIKERTFLGRTNAAQELKTTLVDKTIHNIIDNKSVLIKDSSTATRTAEAILFSIYGQDNITKQRPYEIYLIDNYWMIGGTLPKGTSGGTLFIILSSLDNRIIRLTHGK